MIIYSDRNTSRLQYAVKILFRNYSSEIIITSDEQAWLNATGPKIYYGNKNWQFQHIRIFPSGLLFEEDLRRKDVSVSKWNEVPVIFPNGEQEIPFDILSAVFYMTSRYEEYLPFQGDHMNRFDAQSSLAYRFGFLHLPVVDIWRRDLEKLIQQYWPNSSFRIPEFKFISTVDIDSAFAFRHKGFIRTAGGISRDVFTLKTGNLAKRLNFLLNSEPDPYDTFELMETMHAASNVDSIYFFLLADFGKFDKNVSHLSEPLRNRIRHLSEKRMTGIHPGVASNSSNEILKKEILRLEDITGKKTVNSRQHYLVLKFPGTYRNLISAGITDEYTMGFASDPGFRAGTSFSFPWYDLEAEEITNLNIHPFMVMDATFRYYLRTTPERAVQTIGELMERVRNVNGTFISLWHNESLSEIDPWKGWRVVFERMLHAAAIK